MKRSLWLSFLLMILGAPLWAQDMEVSGKVTIAETGDSLPGVTVVVKGTTLSTVTDANGNYRLKLQGFSNATLEYSFVGFKTATMDVSGSKSDLNMALNDDPMEISEEMVITGFATSVKRRNLANSVATISADEIERAPAQTLDGALSGKFPGVTISANSGAPGGGISLKLRGVSSINATSQPLYVVDGILMSNAQIQSGVNVVTQASGAGNSGTQDQPTNRLADLIPSDIENIEILKGPSAAAIYGAKASNGVVIITTKKGHAGETRYRINQSFGQRSIIKKLGTRRFTAQTAGNSLFDPNVFIDYEEELYGETGDIFQTTFSARGGNEKTTFMASGSALTDDGIVKGTFYDKYSIRLNLEHHVNERLTLGWNTSFVRSVSDRGLTGNDNTGATFGVSLSSTPSYVDLRPVDGVYPNNPFAGSNPIQTRDLMQNEETLTRTMSSFRLDYNVFQSARQTLDFNLLAGIDYFSLENDARFPRELQFEQATGAPGTSILGESESRFENLYLNLTHTIFVGTNTFRTTAGIQLEQSNLNNINVVGTNLIEGQFNLDQATNIQVNHIRNIRRDRGFFVQEEINVGEAIFITAGVRGDSSSANGDEEKFYVFPKASISVRLSEYSFWDGLESMIPEFKIRAAYGETGNLPTTASKFSTFTSINIDGQGGLIPGTLSGNANIEPESSSEIEFGIDATFWGGRGSFEFSYFEQEIDDLILFRRVPPSSGFVSEAINGGTMETDGIEIGLNLNPINSRTMNWTTGLSYYTTDSVITRLDVPAYNTGGFARFLGQYRIQEGLSPTTIIGLETNPDGTLMPLGNETPDFQIGWTNEFSYKGWGIGTLLDWKEGGDVINLTVLLTDLGGTTADLDTPAGQARSNAFLQTTQQFVEDGSYLRLREARIYYDLNRGALNNIIFGKLDSLRISLEGRNIWTDTDYSGYDPEVSNFGNVSIGGSVDVTPFPSSKSYYFTISATL